MQSIAEAFSIKKLQVLLDNKDELTKEIDKVKDKLLDRDNGIFSLTFILELNGDPEELLKCYSTHRKRWGTGAELLKSSALLFYLVAFKANINGYFVGPSGGYQ